MQRLQGLSKAKGLCWTSQLESTNWQAKEQTTQLQNTTHSQKLQHRRCHHSIRHSHDEAMLPIPKRVVKHCSSLLLALPETQTAGSALLACACRQRRKHLTHFTPHCSLTPQECNSQQLWLERLLFSYRLVSVKALMLWWCLAQWLS